MKFWRRWFAGARWLPRDRWEQQMNEELRFHVEQQIAENIAAGMSPQEARRRAIQQFGGAEGVKEACREQRSGFWLETFWADVRYGLRMLRRSPGFAIVAVLTLALGIGANTAIFSVVNAVLLRPLPYKDAARLVIVRESTRHQSAVSVSYPDFLDWRRQSRSFSEMVAIHNLNFNLSGVTQPESIAAYEVSPDFLSLLGVRPILGRNFLASEEHEGTPPVVLLSYQFWQSHFGGSLDVLGRTLTLDGRSFAIVGVLPASFHFLDRTDVLAPIGAWTGDEAISERGDRGDMIVIGRLAPGATFAQGRAEMQGIASRLDKEYPKTNSGIGVALSPIRDEFVSDIRLELLILFGAVIFVLLIACVNVANLFLARGADRGKEMAVRIAFGASQSRVIRQMFTESLVLTLLGGILGVLLAVSGTKIASHLILPASFQITNVRMDGGVFLFVGGVIVVVAFAFGLIPALQGIRSDLQAELKEGGRNSTPTARQNRLRAALAVAEISLALILLAGAGLMTKSLYRLLSVNPGFRPERVLTMEMDLRTAQYAKDPVIRNFWKLLLDRVRAIPGVQTAAVGTDIPMTSNHNRTDITLDGFPLPRPGDFPHPDIHTVSPDYVRTLGIPLLRGRIITASDNENAPLVGLINSTLARRYWPKSDPIGRRFTFGSVAPEKSPEWITIVGVVGDTKLYGLANPARFEVYIPYLQSPANDMDLVVRSATDPGALTSAIRLAAAGVDKDQPVFGVSTMTQLVDNSVSTRRATLILLGLFSGIAVVLAAVGIYGVMTYSVAQRTHEIGIRMALGAQHNGVLRMILRQGAKIALAGVAIGIVASFSLTQLMANMLFGVSAADPATFTAVAVLLVFVALAACYIPARRATRVDPMIALRYE